MRRRVSLLLALTLVCVSLSGICAGADTSFYCNEYSGALFTTEMNNTKEIKLSWSVENATVFVNQTALWNPGSLCYDKTITVADVLCSPKMTITVTNNSEAYYVSATVLVTPAANFTINVQSPVTVTRTEISSETDPDNTTGYYLEDDSFTENVACTTDAGGNTRVGPWHTAVHRKYAMKIGSDYDESDTDGYSRVAISFDVTNDTLRQQLCDPANWTDTTFNGGNTITMATVTVTLQTIAKASIESNYYPASD